MPVRKPKPAEPRALTRKQAQVYDFLVNYLRQHGFMPSIRDIGAKFGWISPNGVVAHLTALAKKGWIIMPEGRSRAIVLPHVQITVTEWRKPEVIEALNRRRLTQTQ